MRPELQLRRPGMQVRRQRIRRASPRLRSTQIYALVLMFLCVLTIISLGSSPMFAARQLEVHGARFTGDETVRRTVGIDGSPNLFRLRTDRIAGELAALPAVESVRIEVRLPDTVVVTVVEREPRLIWVIGDRRYVVDDTGLIFGQVDTVGNPVYRPPAASSPSAGPSTVSSSASPASPDESSSGDGSEAPATDPPDGRVAQAAKATPKPTPKPTPKATPKASPTAEPSPTTSLPPPPSLLPVPTADPSEMAGPQVVTLPVLYDRRAQDSGLTLGDVVDPLALDAGYRLAGLTPADVGSQAPSLDVVLDDGHGFTLSSGPNGWVAEFGFYTQTLRKDTVIPMQVRDLRALLLNYGEKHVAWAWLVADIADNRVNTYLAK